MGITRIWRNEAPTSYLLKLEGYSNINGWVISCPYESAVFYASGYQWRLILYPGGNQKDGVENHISIYARLETSISDLPRNLEIQVDLKFFVFDQNQKKYLTVQDGIVKNYSEAKKEFGISKLIELSTLNDQRNGYIVNDTCIFGVEILNLVSPTVEKVTLLQNPPNNKFTWKIFHFSQLIKQIALSDKFLIGERYWRIRVDINGGGSDENGLSAYLVPSSTRLPNIIVAGIYARFKLRILNQRNLNHVEHNVITFFEAVGGFCRGTKKLISNKDLYDQTKGYLVNNAIVLEVEMLWISQTQVVSKVDDYICVDYVGCAKL